MMERILAHPRWSLTAWWFLLALVITDRILLLSGFGFTHTGSDDVLFWNIANDMLHGQFREPYVYGQNYNPPFEPLFAVPMLAIGLPFHIAMPVITSVLALFPFLSFAWWHRRNGRLPAALVFLTLPLLLPVEWGMLTTITRGFVPGIAWLGLLPFAHSIQRTTTRAIAIGLIAGLAIFTNPNTLVFLVPFLLHQVFDAERWWRTAAWTAVGLVPFLLMQRFAMHFYVARPWRLVHRFDDWRMDFAWKALIPEGLGQLDRHFAWLAPLPFPDAAPYLLIAVVVLLIAQRSHRRALAVCAGILFCTMSLAFPKVHDGTDNVFFPFSRMFLGVPLLLAWSWGALRIPARPATFVPAILMTIGSFIFVHKMRSTPGTIEREMASMDRTPVTEYRYADLKHRIDHLADLASEQKAGMVIALDGTGGHDHITFSYGGPVLRPDLPPTLYVGPDRRWWARSGLDTTRIGCLLLVGGDDGLWHLLSAEHPGFERIVDQNEMIHVWRGEGPSVGEVIRWTGKRW